jgi:hypothetical protein
VLLPGSLNPDSAKHQKMIVQMHPVDRKPTGKAVFLV